MNSKHMRRLQIDISGNAGSGKTTFARALVDICRKHGIAVEVRDDDLTVDGAPLTKFTNEDQLTNEDKLESLKGKVEVIVQTRHVVHPPRLGITTPGGSELAQAQDGRELVAVEQVADGEDGR